MKPELDEPVKLRKPNRTRGKGGKFAKVKTKKRKPAIEGYEPPVYRPKSGAARMTMSDDDKIKAQFWRKGKK